MTNAQAMPMPALCSAQIAECARWDEEVDRIISERCTSKSLSLKKPQTGQGRTRTATWMGDLGPDIIGHLPFSQLKMVGTHNSGTSQMDSVDSELSGDGTKALLGLPWGVRHLAKVVTTPWARTQSLSLLEQLEAGYRYLDIRLITNETPWRSEKGNFDVGELWVAHGLFSIPHRRVVDQVLTFARMYPKEIFILDYNRLLELDENKEERSMGDDLVRARLRHTKRRQLLYGEKASRRQAEVRLFSQGKREERTRALLATPTYLLQKTNKAYITTDNQNTTIISATANDTNNYYCECDREAAHCHSLLFDDDESGCSNFADETPLRRLLRDLQPLIPHIIPRSCVRDGKEYSITTLTMNQLWALPPADGMDEQMISAAQNNNQQKEGVEDVTICSCCQKVRIRPTIFVTFPTHLKRWLQAGLTQLRSQQQTQGGGYCDASGGLVPLQGLSDFPLPSSHTLRRIPPSQTASGRSANEPVIGGDPYSPVGQPVSSPTTILNPMGSDTVSVEEARSSAHNRMLSRLKTLSGEAENTSRDTYLNQIWHNRRTPDLLMAKIKMYLSNELKEEMLKMVSIREQELLYSASMGAVASASAHRMTKKQAYHSTGPAKVFITGTIITIGAKDVIRGVLTGCFRGFASPICCWNRSHRTASESIFAECHIVEGNTNSKPNKDLNASSTSNYNERFRVPLINSASSSSVSASDAPHEANNLNLQYSSEIPASKDNNLSNPNACNPLSMTLATTTASATCCNNVCGAGIFYVAREINDFAMSFFNGMSTPYSPQRWEILSLAVNLALGDSAGAGSAETSKRGKKELLMQLVLAHWGHMCCCVDDRQDRARDDERNGAIYSSPPDASMNTKIENWWWADSSKHFQQNATDANNNKRPFSCLWCRTNTDRNILQLDYAEDACLAFERRRVCKRDDNGGMVSEPPQLGPVIDEWTESAMEVCLRATIRYALATRP